MSRKRRSRYISVLTVLAVFVLLTLALIGQNIQRAGKAAEPAIALLETDAAAKEVYTRTDYTTVRKGQTYECLLLWDSEDGNSELFHRLMPQTLQDMRVSYVEADIRKEEIPDLGAFGFEKVVIGFADYEYVKDFLRETMNWAKEGGEVLIALIPEISNTSLWMSPYMGIEDESLSFYETAGIRIKDGFMLTGGRDSYGIAAPFQSSRLVMLSDQCRTYMESADESQIPLLWEKEHGEGKLVVVNLGIYEKAFRGIYGAAYSLLGSVCVYPVINGSSFFIDDFPTPFWERTEADVLEEYQMSVENFYSRIWWNSMKELAEKYDFPYTATILENYGDLQKAPFEENENSTQYQYFGNMILNGGGEIGLHGYNHMPLSLSTDSYKEVFPDYKEWESTEDMRGSIEALLGFSRHLFPERKFQVYVPPSNILSEEGRAMLAQSYPEIRSIAGIFLPDDGVTEQEFEVGEDGLIDTPRIAVGYEVEADRRIAALSELNLHYVNTHCQYPATALDAGRDGNSTWEEMLESFTEYVDWVYQAAPGIRGLTGSELAAAVQRFYWLGIQKKETAESLNLTLERFHDEAWLMLRFNDFEPDTESVEGGVLTRLEGGLYLLEAREDEIRIPGREIENEKKKES